MVSTILGRKIGMTQVFDEDDNVVPVTVIQAGPCVVSQVKTKASDGYDAVQIGFGTVKHVNKPMAGHFAKAGVEPMRTLREVRVENGEEHKCGDVVTVADFADVKNVDVTGTSKGKGFQGTIKRWNFSHDPRFAQPAQAGLHRSVRLSRARPQGPAHGRPHGRRARHRQEPQAGSG